MKRSSYTSRSRTDTKASAGPTRGRRSRFGAALRKAVLALGLAGLAWVVARRARSGDGGVAPDEIRERVGDVVPEATERLSGESGGEADDEWAEQGAREPGAEGRARSPSSIAGEESQAGGASGESDESDAASEDER